MTESLESKGNRPTRVLCLGMSRTGTMSLRAAFETLDYHGTYHYRVPSIEQPEQSEFWVRALKKKYEQHEQVTREEFDPVYSNYEVISDSPSIFFWRELLSAYPEAQVILQTRPIDQWYKSHMSNIWPFNNDYYGPSWNPYRRFFQWLLPRNAFWEFSGLQAKYCHGLDFPETGKKRYIEHNRTVLEACKEAGRPVLEYDVAMGWEPLCKYLGKEVPSEPFPRLNDTATFQATWAPILAEVRSDIHRRMLFWTVGVLGGFSALVLYRQPLIDVVSSYM